jgi:hypothetical protein
VVVRKKKCYIWVWSVAVLIVTFGCRFMSERGDGAFESVLRVTHFDGVVEKSRLPEGANISTHPRNT